MVKGASSLTTIGSSYVLTAMIIHSRFILESHLLSISALASHSSRATRPCHFPLDGRGCYAPSWHAGVGAVTASMSTNQARSISPFHHCVRACRPFTLWDGNHRAVALYGYAQRFGVLTSLCADYACVGLRIDKFRIRKFLFSLTIVRNFCSLKQRVGAVETTKRVILYVGTGSDFASGHKGSFYCDGAQ